MALLWTCGASPFVGSIPACFSFGDVVFNGSTSGLQPESQGSIPCISTKPGEASTVGLILRCAAWRFADDLPP